MSNSKKEVRFSSKIEVRTKGDGKILAGYAAVFNSKSEDFGGVSE
jgi:phage head maturation protease